MIKTTYLIKRSKDSSFVGMKIIKFLGIPIWIKYLRGNADNPKWSNYKIMFIRYEDVEKTMVSILSLKNNKAIKEFKVKW